MSSQAIQLLGTMDSPGISRGISTVQMVPANGLGAAATTGFDGSGFHPAVNRQKQRAEKARQVRARMYQLNCHLKRSLKVDMDKSRQILGELIDVTLSEPRTRILYETAPRIQGMVKTFLDNPRVIAYLTRISVHDDATQMHMINVMLYCMGYAFMENRDPEEIKAFGLAGLLHDVGKIFIPDYLLRSRRDLSRNEFGRIRKHPVTAYKMLENTEFDPWVLEAARDHHERMDGSGYPQGKTGDRISDIARVVGVIDIFEALTSWRPYREALKPLEALERIKQDVTAGKLDPDIFYKFAKSVVGMSSQVFEATWN